MLTFKNKQISKSLKMFIKNKKQPHRFGGNSSFIAVPATCSQIAQKKDSKAPQRHACSICPILWSVLKCWAKCQRGGERNTDIKVWKEEWRLLLQHCSMQCWRGWIQQQFSHFSTPCQSRMSHSGKERKRIPKIHSHLLPWTCPLRASTGRGLGSLTSTRRGVSWESQSQGQPLSMLIPSSHTSPFFHLLKAAL